MSAPVTILTGAGSGIGHALALMLAAEGHTLHLVGRTEGKLERTRQEILSAHPGAQVRLHCIDLCDSDLASAAVDSAIASDGGVDCLVNCAGIAPLVPIDRTDESVLEHAFMTNAFGPAFLIARCWPHFMERRAGCIVNISSMASLDPFPGFFAYAASKAALDSFTRSCHTEGARRGIRAFCINPGAVETPLLRSNFPERVLPHAKTLSPEAVARVALDCIAGKRDADCGKPIPVRSP
jgi:NAD(P)-dependent dehydrogenase (short-subunit alcohol dehydrogenase family)